MAGFIEVDTQTGEFTEVRIILPRTATLITNSAGRRNFYCDAAFRPCCGEMKRRGHSLMTLVRRAAPPLPSGRRVSKPSETTPRPARGVDALRLTCVGHARGVRDYT